MKKQSDTVNILCIDFEKKVITVDKIFPDLSKCTIFRQLAEEVKAFLLDHPPPDFEVINGELCYIPDKKINTHN